MSSAEREDPRTRELIERLLIDPAFRAEFRRDPAAACVAAGLPDLADDLAASSASMDPLAARESRSSLAGVVMAVAVEGISVAEAQALMQHGLSGARAPGGGKLLHGGALRSPLGHVHHATSPASLEHELRRTHGGSPAHAAVAPTHGQPAGSAPPASPAGHDQPAASTPAASSAAHDQAAASTTPAAPSAQDQPAPSSPPSAPPAVPTPPEPGAQPAHGGVVAAWPDQHAGGGAGDSAGGGLNQATPPPGDPAGALDSPQLSAPPDARAFLTGGGADPRLTAVLNSTLANHSIGLGQVTTVTDPVPMQVVSIVSVDGQPVGPSNFAARDLVTELAALDPSLRPTEIGTPWPIHAPGFFTDPAHQGQLHLAFLPESGGQAPAASAPVAATPEPAATPPPEVGPETAPTAAPATAGPTPGHYASMLPDDAKIGRTDMGVDADLNPGEPITAPGTSRVLGITPNWYRGQPYVALQLLDGPMKGHNYYIAEQITPAVSVGQIVQQGQPIGHYAASGTGIEMGWAGSNWEQTLAQSTSGYSEGQVTPAGASFHNFLEGLAHGGTPAGDTSPEAAPAAAETVPPGPDPDDTPPPSASTASPAPPAAPETAPMAPAPSAPPPAAPFSVLESRQHGPVRHTVQFLPAVQPSPGSPLYGHAPQPVSAPPAAVPPLAAPPAGAEQAPEQPALASVLDQAPTPTSPTAGSISVSSSLLTPGQQKFAGRLAELTGLDPRVVAAWELAEESGGAAQGREAASNFNWLNIGYFDSGAGRIAFDKTFSDPVSAAEQSAKFLKGEWGGASPSIRAILNSVGHSPDEQMAAIANSDWASSHYGGGANLHGTYDELSDIRIEKSSLT